MASVSLIRKEQIGKKISTHYRAITEITAEIVANAYAQLNGNKPNYNEIGFGRFEITFFEGAYEVLKAFKSPEVNEVLANLILAETSKNWHQEIREYIADLMTLLTDENLLREAAEGFNGWPGETVLCLEATNARPYA